MTASTKRPPTTATPPGRASPPSFTVRNCAGSPDPGRRTPDEPRKEQQHRDQIEQALEDNRRERRRRIQPLTAREQVRPQHFADTARQQKRGGKADNRGLEGRC